MYIISINTNMAITRRIKLKLDIYGVSLPTDKRTRAHANILRKNNWPDETYKRYLKDIIKGFVAKEKKILTQVARNKVREEVIAEVQKKNKLSKFGKQNFLSISKIQRNYLKNKLFYAKPSNSSFKSYFEFNLNNTRPEIVSMTNFDPEHVIMRIGFDPEFTPPTVSVEQLEKYISFRQFEKFLMTKIRYKVFITANFLTLFDGNIEGKGMTSSAIKLYTKSDVNSLLANFISAYNKCPFFS